jgi:O-antigen/teichoic acid export membrane protein
MTGLVHLLQMKLRVLLPGSPALSQEQQRSYERYRRIAWSGLTGIASKMVSVLVGIATVPLVVNYVGKEQFGLWMVVSSLVVWMQLADFGIANGLFNALAEANGKKDDRAASGYLSTAVAATCALGLLCLPLVWLAYQYLPWGRLLNITDSALADLAADAMLVVGLVFVINIPISLSMRVYLAYQRAYVINAAAVVTSIINFVALWLGVQNDLSLLWLVGISAGAPVFTNLLLWFGLRRVGLSLRLHLGLVRKEFLARVAASSVPLFLFQCGALLVNQLVNVMIANLASLSMVADFNVIQRVYLFVFSLAAAVSQPFYAAIREAFEKGEIDWVVRAVRHSLGMRILATLPFALLLLIAGDKIIQLWVGQEFSRPIGTLGWGCVLLCLVFSAVSSLLSEVLSGLDDIWAQIGVVFVSAAVVLTGMALLISPMGVPGVYLAFAVSTVLPIFWLSNRLLKKVRAL